MSKYKFHLAFENSESESYVTEKYYLALSSATIPIYFGAPNIEQFYPTHTIHPPIIKVNVSHICAYS
jgi:alpha-1,4-fucosyltransferase